jgi:hypothetical protein
MQGSLGDGFRAIQAMAINKPVGLSERSPWKEKLVEELSYEAHKFVIYRLAKMLDRELVSIHRLRSLNEMLSTLRLRSVSRETVAAIDPALKTG